MVKMSRVAAALVSAAALTMTGAGTAQADGLLGDLLSPLVCGLQNNVAGNHNQISQSGTCDQAATTSPATDGITGREVVSASDEVEPGGVGIARVLCPVGKASTGGGNFLSIVTDWADVESQPYEQDGRTGWEVTAHNVGTQSGFMAARAVCVDSAE